MPRISFIKPLKSSQFHKTDGSIGIESPDIVRWFELNTHNKWIVQFMTKSFTMYVHLFLIFFFDRREGLLWQFQICGARNANGIVYRVRFVLNVHNQSFHRAWFAPIATNQWAALPTKPRTTNFFSPCLCQ